MIILGILHVIDRIILVPIYSVLIDIICKLPDR